MKMKTRILTLILSFVLITACKEEAEQKVGSMRVNYYTVECTGEMTSQCLLVQEGNKIGSDEWSYFYFWNSIEGFDYEESFIYDLIVEKESIENPPQDGSSIKYKLIEIVSKKPHS